MRGNDEWLKMDAWGKPPPQLVYSFVVGSCSLIGRLPTSLATKRDQKILTKIYHIDHCTQVGVKAVLNEERKLRQIRNGGLVYVECSP